MGVPKVVVELVERFGRNVDAYKKGRYNETQVRREFIDPFFEALGWDVNNTQGYAEQYKDVIHEDSIRVGSATKAPDYCFRIGGTRKFFLEAKKPSIDIKGDPSPAYQLRRYAWSGKLPLSILTDFEELAVYDCRIRPVKTDKSSKGRILYFTYEDYIEKWDEIAAIFSRKAVLKGSFDKFAETSKSKRGTAEVDASFLAEIEEWRDTLARNIALRNSQLNHRELNFAVQRTIDRIIFLRICEDRGVEPYGELMALLNGEKVYDRLLGLYRRADDRYNSGLFHFSKETGRHDPPDELTPELAIDDKTLKDIFRRLYYPDCPFEFSVLPAEILGQVYEQFLGSTISLTAGHRAKVEHKPEVKKAGGVFYTPAYIVDYIVQNTVGKLVEGKTPRQVSRIKTLDPACGSGSFLLGAYQYLLDWHLQYYLDNEPKKWAKKKAPPICATDGTHSYKLTLNERKRILLDNLYGVDIDSQAVEVTKLSLLLKVLEGEKQLMLVATERALPDLSENIKCGNSLIGSDFYKNQQMDLFDDELCYKVNPFDWEKEFAHIFSGKNSGFDAVIGNPPYIKEYTNRQVFHDLRDTKLYKYYQGKMDLWYVFGCLALDLLKNGGLHSYIATNNWITNSGASKLRNKILSESNLKSFIDFGSYMVFQNASIQTMVYVLEKTGKVNRSETKYKRLMASKMPENFVLEFLKNRKCDPEIGISFSTKLKATDEGSALTFVDKQTLKVVDTIQSRGDYQFKKGEVAQGIVMPQDFVISKHLPKLKNKKISIGDGIFNLSDTERKSMKLNKTESEYIKPFYTTEELGQYYGCSDNKSWVIYTDKKAVGQIAGMPNIKKHLDQFKEVITSDNKPYGLHRARKEDFFIGEKIISLRKTSKPYFTYTDFPCYVSQTFFVLKPKDINLKYLTGLLNSKVVMYWLRHKGKMQGDMLQVDKEPLLNIPIRTIDFSNKSDKRLHNKVVSLVEVMLGLHKKLAATKTGDATVRLERQIAATDGQIDALVYELYGLTKKEIEIVKGVEQ